MIVVEVDEILGRPTGSGIPLRAVDGGDCFSSLGISRLEETRAPADSVQLRILSRRVDGSELFELGRGALRELAESWRRDVRAGNGGGVDEPRAEAQPTLELHLWRDAGAAAIDRRELFIRRRVLRSLDGDLYADERAVLIAFARGSDGELLPVELVAPPGVGLERDGDLIDRQLLAGKAVTVVGLGSVGSAVATDLARSGLGRFYFGDGERLEAGNVVRHAAGLSDIGRQKTWVARDLACNRNANAEITCLEGILDGTTRKAYQAAFAQSDLVICATDNRESRLLCNRSGLDSKTAVIFAGLTAGAYAGMVFLVRPFETMCYQCFALAFPDAAADRGSDQAEYSGGPDGHLAIDIWPITNLVTRLALVELQSGSSSALTRLRQDLDASWYLWINRREGEYASLSPLGAEGDGPTILRWYPVKAERLEECPHCGTAKAVPTTGRAERV